jgi:uncharacterized protein YbjT (DUF2867 family)
MNLAVTGTGILGSEICRQLVAKQMPARALVRASSDPRKVESLKNLGVETVVGDLRDRRSLEVACRGVRRVLCSASSMPSPAPGNGFEDVDRDGVMALIDVAKAAGVEHFVYISGSTFNGNPDLAEAPLIRIFRLVEQKLMANGLSYTILRGSAFMDIWLSPALGFDAHNATARVLGTGDNPVSYVAVRDVAQLAIAALMNPAARNRILDTGGPEPISPNAVIQLFEELTGREFQVERIPVEALRAQKAAARNPVELTFACFMLANAAGDRMDMTEAIREFDLKPMSVREFARSTLQQST